MAILIIEHAQALFQNLGGKTGINKPCQILCERNPPDFNHPPSRLQYGRLKTREEDSTQDICEDIIKAEEQCKKTDEEQWFSTKIGNLPIEEPPSKFSMKWMS
jgi:hypothetical protein